jgi:hypothetical protein
MPMLAVAAANALTCFLVQCAEPDPVRIDDSTYYMRQHGLTIDQVRGPLMYRSAVLTLEKGYDLMLLEPLEPKQKAKSYVRSEALSRSLPMGWYARQNVQSNKGTNPEWRPTVERSPSTTTINGAFVVSMYRRPLSDSLMAAIDARQMKELLQPYVTGETRAQMPELWKLVRQATVAHVQIALPTPDVISPRPVFSTPAADSSMPLRDASEFVDPFDEIEGPLYSLYEQRRVSGAAGHGGTVVLSLVVMPNGKVSDSHVASTNMTDQVFVEALRSMAARFRFFREDVMATRVESIPISFTPRR